MSRQAGFNLNWLPRENLKSHTGDQCHDAVYEMIKPGYLGGSLVLEMQQIIHKEIVRVSIFAPVFCILKSAYLQINPDDRIGILVGGSNPIDVIMSYRPFTFIF